MRRFVCLLLMGSVGCGARTLLDTDDPQVDGGRRDGGIDARVIDGAVDAGTDGGSPDGGTLVLRCGRSVQYTAPRRAITLTAEAASPTPPVVIEWTLVSDPGGDPRVEPTGEPGSIRLTPEQPGSHRMRAVAHDAANRMASCEVDVQSIVGPPAAICPKGEQRTPVGVPLRVIGDGFDDEEVIGYMWALLESPPGSTPRLGPSDQPVLEFQSDTPGIYRLQLLVFDADGASGRCETVVRVTTGPRVVCPTEPILAPTRQPVSVEAQAFDDLGIVARAWSFVERAPGSAAVLSPTDTDRTTFVPDRRGRYRLRYRVTDVEGLQASCEIDVIGTPTPPTVSCMDVTTLPLRDTALAATAEDDSGIVAWRWEITDRPDGSSASPPTPANAANTLFRPDIAGSYVLTVTARDEDGMVGSCQARVSANNVDGLRVEMFWDTVGTDMDTHLLNPEATRWFVNEDCYYANCNVTSGRNLEWGAPGPDDNPRLDLDDTNGLGPENINITRPVAGTYRVGVHNFSGRGPNRVTVQIYCAGSTTEPRATFGPVALQDRGSNDFWRVADVTIDAAGGCTITDLATGGRPNIQPDSDARNRR